MTLAECFTAAERDGYTMAADLYSHHGRPLRNWKREAESDWKDWEYVGGLARQTSRFPSNEYRFWKGTA